MNTLLIFELVDAVTVLTAGWMIARVLGAGGPRIHVVLEISPSVDPLAVIVGDEYEDCNVIPLRPTEPGEPEGVEYPASSWRQALGAPALNGRL